MGEHRYGVGDVVRWVSRGWDAPHEGRVAAIVPRGRSAYAYLREGVRMSALHGAPLNPHEDRYMVEVESAEKGLHYLLPACAAVDRPDRRVRAPKGKRTHEERLEALRRAHQAREKGPRGRYAARCG